MADQLTLQTIGGTATHTLDDAGNATHIGTVTAAAAAISGTATVGTLAATTLRAGSGLWSTCPVTQDPSVLHTFFDDFLALLAPWTITEDDAADAQVANDVQHGVVTLTQKATTDNDAAQMTWAQESFKLTAGKRLWWEARIRCPAGATELDWFVGLAEAEDITGVTDNMPANGIGFKKDDGDTNIDLSSSDGGTDTTRNAVGTLVANTWIRLGLLFDGGASGAATITPYVDGTAGTAITVTYATMAEMAPFFMVRNGDATTTQVLDIDYVKVAAER